MLHLPTASVCDRPVSSSGCWRLRSLVPGLPNGLPRTASKRGRPLPRSGLLLGLFAALFMSWVLASCDDDWRIAASDYDQTCTVPEDCVAIVVGDVCGCRCEMAAINIGDHSRYASDAASANCDDDDSVFSGACASCPKVAATCRDTRCEVVSSP